MAKKRRVSFGELLERGRRKVEAELTTSLVSCSILLDSSYGPNEQTSSISSSRVRSSYGCKNERQKSRRRATSELEIERREGGKEGAKLNSRREPP